MTRYYSLVLLFLAACLTLSAQTLTVTNVGKVSIQANDGSGGNASLTLSPDAAKALKPGDKLTATLTADAAGTWIVVGQNATGDPKDAKVTVNLSSDSGSMSKVVTSAEAASTYAIYKPFTLVLK